MGLWRDMGLHSGEAPDVAARGEALDGIGEQGVNQRFVETEGGQDGTKYSTTGRGTGTDRRSDGGCHCDGWAGRRLWERRHASGGRRSHASSSELAHLSSGQSLRNRT